MLVLFFSLFVIFTTGCGLFYDYPSRESLTASGDPSWDGGTFNVTEVIDGDTIILGNGEHIRLLGINTPEEGMYFYEEAKEVLEAMVGDRKVTLEKDISDFDMYGRRLRYVFRDGLFVNMEMVRRGFANIYTCPPDVRYSREFLEAERYARVNNMGLWERSEFDRIKIEVFYDAPGNDNENVNEEYVLLENNGDIILDTTGWTIKDSGTNIYGFKPYKFYPGSVLVIFSGNGKDGDGIFYWNSPKPVWNNDFDTLYLRDKEGLLIGIFNY